MFSHIRSDFGDFVSSLSQETSTAVQQVKDDAIHVFEQLDERVSKEKLTEAEKEVIFRMDLTEVYTTPLELKRDEKEEKDEKEEMNEKEEKDVKEHNPEDFEERELQLFLESFCVKEKTSEISFLLEKHDTTLKLRFEELVPLHVTYKDFWKRHFYRCDAARIERAWAAEEAKTKTARADSVSAVKNAIGKPVNALMQSNPLRVAMQSNPLRVAMQKLTGTLDKKTNECDEMQSALVYTRKELEDLQHAIAASNHRILSLRTKLDKTMQCLTETELHATELKAELEETRAALTAKKDYATKLEQRVAELLASVTTDKEEGVEDDELSGEDDPEAEAVISEQEPAVDKVAGATPQKEEESEISSVTDPVITEHEEEEEGGVEDLSLSEMKAELEENKAALTAKEEHATELERAVAGLRASETTANEEEESVEDDQETESVITEQEPAVDKVADATLLKEEESEETESVITEQEPAVDKVADATLQKEEESEESETASETEHEEEEGAGVEDETLSPMKQQQPKVANNSPTSIMDRLRVDTSVFKLATGRLWGGRTDDDDDDDEGSVVSDGSGWVSEEEEDKELGVALVA